jgi:uncharacterized repeat protein (TIGR03833 family)
MRSFRRIQRTMNTVPKHSTLGPRVPVNIVLKADQRTGKLTRGLIANILTKGDHPRGVKVRLESGAIGRVQSLATAASSSSQSNPPSQWKPTATTGGTAGLTMDHGSAVSRNFNFQEDFRKTEAPATSEASLADYIKAPSRNKKKKGRGEVQSSDTSAVPALASSSTLSPSGGPEQQDGDVDEQKSLELEFPSIDSALVAAIWGDSDSIEEARTVLTSLT